MPIKMPAMAIKSQIPSPSPSPIQTNSNFDKLTTLVVNTPATVMYVTVPDASMAYAEDTI